MDPLWYVLFYFIYALAQAIVIVRVGREIYSPVRLMLTLTVIAPLVTATILVFLIYEVLHHLATGHWSWDL